METTILFIAPLHSAMSVPPIIHMTVRKALAEVADGREITDMNLVGAITRSAQEGWAAIRTLASYQHVDAMLLFGKASASVGLFDLEALEPVRVRLRTQPDPVLVVRLPTPLSSWWEDDENIERAVKAIVPLLAKEPVPELPAHLAYDVAEFN